MIKKSNLETSLLNLVEKEILAQNSDDLKSNYGGVNLNETDDFKSTQNLIDSVLIKHRKKKLLNARKQLDLQSTKNSGLKSKIKDGKGFIINLIATGRMPDGLTMAFHKGGDIPDDEVEGIIQDLKDLGIDLNDE